jgi:hypothetical protein
MKWTLKLISEFDSGETMVHEVASLERAEAFIKPARLGMCRFSLICRLGAASWPLFSLKSRQNPFPKGEIHP